MSLSTVPCSLSWHCPQYCSHVSLILSRHLYPCRTNDYAFGLSIECDGIVASIFTSRSRVGCEQFCVSRRHSRSIFIHHVAFTTVFLALCVFNQCIRVIAHRFASVSTLSEGGRATADLMSAMMKPVVSSPRHSGSFHSPTMSSDRLFGNLARPHSQCWLSAQRRDSRSLPEGLHGPHRT